MQQLAKRKVQKAGSRSKKTTQKGKGRNKRRGDTLVEVLFAVTIFGVVALLSITSMNRGVTIAEAKLEESMARMEIDAQAEAIRFIHNSYANDHELVNPEYKGLWSKIKEIANRNSTAQSLSNISTCNEKYNATDNGILGSKSFVVNTRNIDTRNVDNTIIAATSANFRQTTLYPRILYTGSGGNSESAAMGADGSSYTTFLRAEGIWVYPVPATTGGDSSNSNPPQFYDFHISTCWYSPRGDRPTTLGTILRLYNPEYVER